MPATRLISKPIPREPAEGEKPLKALPANFGPKSRTSSRFFHNLLEVGAS